MFDRFETNDLLIRKIQITDTDAIFENWAQEKDVSRYTTWLPHKSRDETRSYIESCIEAWAHENYTWTIEYKKSSEIVGSFAARVNAHKVDIGYLLAKNWWGRGIMTTVVTSFIHQAFRNNSIERIGAVCDVENPASKRVMEKAGMQYEGVLSSWMVHPNMEAKARDCHCLSITRNAHSQNLSATD